jgi:hypothetical protein
MNLKSIVIQPKKYKQQVKYESRILRTHKLLSHLTLRSLIVIAIATAINVFFCALAALFTFCSFRTVLLSDFPLVSFQILPCGVYDLLFLPCRRIPLYRLGILCNLYLRRFCIVIEPLEG